MPTGIVSYIAGSHRQEIADYWPHRHRSALARQFIRESIDELRRLLDRPRKGADDG